MKQVLTEEQFAAFIGIDWADAKHDLCLQAVGCEKRESSTLEHTPEAIEAWASALRRRFDGKPVAICLELNQGRNTTRFPTSGPSGIRQYSSIQPIFRSALDLLSFVLPRRFLFLTPFPRLIRG